MTDKFNSLDPKLDNLFTNLEGQYNLPTGLLKSVAYTESRYNPNATSPVGAKGLFQFMPETAKQYGVDVSDPVSSAEGAAKMYATLLKQNGGDLDKALAGYNWGQGNLNKKGLDNAPQETKNYINQVNNLMGTKKNLGDGAFKPPTKEELQAYNNLMVQQQQAQQQQPQFQPPSQEELQAFNNIMSQAPQQAQPMPQPQAQPPMPQNNMAPSNSEAFTPIVHSQQSSEQNNLSNQASNIAMNPANTVRGQLYNQMLQAGNDPSKFSNFYQTLAPNEKNIVNQILKSQYVKSNNGQERGTIENLLTGIAQSLQSTGNSVEQGLGYATSKITGNDQYYKDASQKASNNATKNDILDVVDPSIARKIGRVGGDIAQFIAGGELAEGTKLTAKGAQAISEMGSKAPMIGKAFENPTVQRAIDLGLQGAGANVIQNPIVDGTDNPNFLAGKIKQGAEGAVLGAGTGVVLDKALSSVANKVNNLKNINKDLPQADKDAIALAESQGIQLMANDLPSANANLIKKGQDVVNSDSTMNNAVAKQQESVNKAVQDVLDKVNKPDSSKIASETGLDKVLADKDNIYHMRAKEIADRIENLNPNDPNAILKASAEAKFIADKAKSSDLYTKADSLAPEGTKVPLDNAKAVFKEVQDYSNSITTPTKKAQFKSTIDDLNSIIQKVDAGNNSFQEINQYFREVGELARTAMKSGDEQSARFLNNFKSALNKDKEALINSLPDSSEVVKYKNAYNQATSFNKNNIQNIKTNNLSSVFETYAKNGAQNLPDGLIDKLVKKGDLGKVQTLFDNLTETGQQAVQQGVINKIMSNIYDANGNININKLMSNYKSYSDPTSGNTPLKVVLDKDAKSAFDNLVKTMGRLQNIGVYKGNPQTGIKGVPMLKGIETAGAILTAKHTMGASLIKPISQFLGSKALVKGLTDPKFQKMLINLNNINHTSPAFNKTLGDISTYITDNIYNESK